MGGAKGKLLLGCATMLFALGLAPAGIFLAQVLSHHAAAEWGEALGTAWSGRVVGLWLDTVLVAIGGAVAATGLGLLLSVALNRRPRREWSFWMTLQLLVLLPSPYVILQGWINLLAGFGLAGLFSRGGLIAFEALTLAPLAAAIFQASQGDEDRRRMEFAVIYRLSWRERLRTTVQQRYAWPATVSFILLFLLIYWQYDAPSILRQNLLALEVNAAFGAFFNHLKAAAVALPAALVGVPPAIILGRLLADRTTPLRQRAEASARVSGWALFPLAALPALTLGVAVTGLLWQVSRPTEFWRALPPALGDAATTLAVGVMSGAGLTILALAAAAAFRGTLPQSGPLIVLPCLGLAVPAVITGIGLTIGRGFLPTELGQGLMPLLLVALFTQLPLMIVFGLAITSAWTVAQTEAVATLGVPFPRVAFRLAGPHLLAAAPILFLVGFALSAREVPASLLNYAADTSTLALTIETMLHFEQPNALSALCLLQLALVTAVALTCLWLGSRGTRSVSWGNFAE